MYLITGAAGFLACIIFIIVIIISAIRGKVPTVPLIAFVLSMVLFLGSGFLYSRTDPQVGGSDFVQYLTRNRTVPPNLEGEWKEDVGKKADSYHGIYINGDTIEIYWVSDGGKSRTLYWAGTYTPPTDGKEPYTWTSLNDTRRTAAAILASGDSSKDFTYMNGKLSYTASVLGVTTEVRAVRQDWGFLTAGEPEEPVQPEAPDTPSGADAAGEEEEPAFQSVSGVLGEFAVEIKNAVLASDYEGNPAIVITYAWTNNSADTTSAMTTMNPRAFQNGVELDSALMTDSESYEAGTSTRYVRPGATVDVQRAYALTSEEAPVEFEVSEWVNPYNNSVSTSIDLAEIAPEEEEAETPKT